MAKTLLLSLLAGVVVLYSVGCAPQTSRTYYARFQNLQGLKAGDPVKMGGSQIGHVREIYFDPAAGDSRITLAISSSAVVKTDSAAAIVASTSRVGSFVVLSSGSLAAPTAENGAILPTVRANASD